MEQVKEEAKEQITDGVSRKEYLRTAARISRQHLEDASRMLKGVSKLKPEMRYYMDVIEYAISGINEIAGRG